MSEAGGIGALEAEALVRRYARALDRLDTELLRGCFCDDAEIEMGAIYRGEPEGFVKVAIGFMGGMRMTRHIVSNTLALGDRWESYVDAWHLLEADGETRELMVRGRYLQRHARQGGEWRLSHHREVVDFGEEHSVDPRWFSAGSGMPKGRRDRQDLSYEK